jgi:hypothetical protein
MPGRLGAYGDETGGRYGEYIGISVHVDDSVAYGMC